jgi:hypothetical protein
MVELPLRNVGDERRNTQDIKSGGCGRIGSKSVASRPGIANRLSLLKRHSVAGYEILLQCSGRTLGFREELFSNEMVLEWPC